MAQVLGIKSVKSKYPAASQPAKKRKSESMRSSYDQDGTPDSTPKKPRKKKGEEAEEKRLRRYRQKPPQSYTERLQRVRTQRMFLIERTRTMAPEATHEEEVFDIAGSTGNVYNVKISKVRCTKPQFFVVNVSSLEFD